MKWEKIDDKTYKTYRYKITFNEGYPPDIKWELSYYNSTLNWVHVKNFSAVDKAKDYALRRDKKAERTYKNKQVHLKKQAKAKEKREARKAIYKPHKQEIIMMNENMKTIKQHLLGYQKFLEDIGFAKEAIPLKHANKELQKWEDITERGNL